MVALRFATAADIPALEALIRASARALNPEYTTGQIEALLGGTYGVDRNLIADGHYFVAETGVRIVGCGGWSDREAVYGGDALVSGRSVRIDPVAAPARIRAFFVHPDYARRGIGRSILDASEAAARAAGFTTACLLASLTGQRLYERYGWIAGNPQDTPVGDSIVTFVPMTKML